MARIRTIKPEICVSEQFVECSTSARLLFVLSLCFFDDGGVHVASARTLKMEVFPGDDCTPKEVQSYVDELISQKLWVTFEHDGKLYWYVTGWKHQKIDRPTYKHPSPLNNQNIAELSTTPRRDIDESSPPEGKGRESKGKETTSKKKFSDDDMAIANEIFDVLKAKNPEHKPPNFESWASDVRLMRERDNRTPESIRELFAWAQADSFWQDNILSPGKLRDKFDQLTMKKNKIAQFPQQESTGPRSKPLVG